MSVENTLAERGNRYGDFTDHARLCQDLKDVMTTFAVVQNTPNSVAVHLPWGELPATHKQALEVIADKIARILSGDPNYADNWHDIQGYAKLVEDRLPKPEEPAAAIDDDSPRQQAVAQNGNTGEHYDELPVEGTPIDPADVDISDEEYPSDLPPDQWQKGDVVVALHKCAGQFSRLKRYTLRSANELQTVNVVADDSGNENGWGEHNFRFHSRPTK